jgi:hypothetical protein
MVALAEKKIGEELVKGRENNKILKPDEYHQKCGMPTALPSPRSPSLA